LTKELGRGAFAVCKMGCEAEDVKKVIAVKIIDKNKLQLQADKNKLNKELEHIKREINHLKVRNPTLLLTLYIFGLYLIAFG
jgi:hypothetical protein